MEEIPEDITYEYIQKHGIGTNAIIVKSINNKNQVVLEKFDGSTDIIADDMETVFLYGAPFQPTKMISGVDISHRPYFIGIITEGILQVQDYVLTSEKRLGENKNLYIFVVIT